MDSLTRAGSPDKAAPVAVRKRVSAKPAAGSAPTVQDDRAGPVRFAVIALPVLRDRRLSPAARLVLLALQEFGFKTLTCFPALKTIAAAAGLSVCTARRALAQLAELGFVAVEATDKNPTGRVLRLLWMGDAGRHPVRKQADAPSQPDTPPLRSQTERGGSQPDTPSLRYQNDTLSNCRVVTENQLSKQPDRVPATGTAATPRRRSGRAMAAEEKVPQQRHDPRAAGKARRAGKPSRLFDDGQPPAEYHVAQRPAAELAREAERRRREREERLAEKKVAQGLVPAPPVDLEAMAPAQRAAYGGLTDQQRERFAEMPPKSRQDVLGWLASGHSSLVQEARKYLRPRRPAAPATPPAELPLPDAIRMLKDPGAHQWALSPEVTDRIMRTFGDHRQSWKTIEGFCDRIVHGEWPPESLIEPLQKTLAVMGDPDPSKRPKKPAAYFVTSVKNWIPENMPAAAAIA